MYDQEPEVYYPSEEELKARNRRNIGLALALSAFMILAFITMVTRSGAFS